MEFVIDEEFAEVRLDRFLRKKYPNIALSEIFKGIRIGKIKINNKKPKENYRLKLNDKLLVFFDNVKNEENSKENKEENKDKNKFFDINIKEIKKSIVYEDEKILIFNKNQNMVMHKGSGHDYGISEIFKEYYQNLNFNFVNRIDKSTSGLVIGAKSLVVARNLAEDIRNREIIKKYYILVDGIVNDNEFEIISYLKKAEKKMIEVSQYEEGAKKSKSIFNVIERGEKYTLLVGELESGRTHQLRIHLANNGNFIVGDNKYGNPKRENFLYLFSYYIKIPRYNLVFELPVPDNFLNKLKKGK
ncbi:MAG: RluA family pseudouridine synthase [Fusobacteriaceae bacterium]|jgi:23S rRNA pseudouridine955/2504/2580 synthase|nr:RluA family pseudouridine synthase [Fusobacteriaceae bacterium]